MFKKYAVLFGIIIALTLLVIATFYYPGGSQADKNSVGYTWSDNYLSNLFSQKAMNGAASGSRPWAVAGMLFISVSFALFFIDFSKKVSQKSAAIVIKFCGPGAMLCAFLATTPYHNIMVTHGVTLALIAIFYITVFVFRSKLHWFKALSVLCLLVFYVSSFIYNFGNYIQYLPILQKTELALSVTLVLCLQYFTSANNFQPKVSKKHSYEKIYPTDAIYCR